MKPVGLDEVLDLAAYERVREDYRLRIIELKRSRRISVGPTLTFLFENRETVCFQIQEMLRTERIVQEERILAELDVYNELMPRDFELSATLMIEITEMNEIRPTLDRLIGLHECVCMQIDQARVQASFDLNQLEEERISAVHYLRFPLGPELSTRFCQPSVPVHLHVTHPSYRASVLLEGATRESLTRDLPGPS